MAAGGDATLLAAAREVAQAAAGFPLALDQAGAYVEETGCSLQDYATLWREHSRQLLAERGDLAERHNVLVQHVDDWEEEHAEGDRQQGETEIVGPDLEREVLRLMIGVIIREAAIDVPLPELLQQPGHRRRVVQTPEHHHGDGRH